MTGPEQIKPAESEITTDLAGWVRLRIPQSGKAIETLPAISVPGLVKRAADTYADKIALAWKEGKDWKKFTYRSVLVENKSIL